MMNPHGTDESMRQIPPYRSTYDAIAELADEPEQGRHG